MATIAQLDRRGHSQHAIAAAVQISQPMVCQYLKKIRKRYEESLISNRAELVAEKLEQLREVRQEAWDAWERSKLNAVTTRVHNVKAREDAGKKGKDKLKTGRTLSESLVKLKEIVTIEGRLPASEYLGIVLKTLDAERELLGLDEYDPGKMMGAAVGVVWDQLSKGEPPDTIEEQLALPPKRVEMVENGHGNGEGDRSKS